MLDVLNEYKVVFDTVAATALIAMAIAVSIAQLGQARQQNRLVAAQLSLTRGAHLPDIHVYSQYEHTRERKFVSEEIVIENLGAPARELRTEAVVFVDTRAHSTTGETVEHRFPLHGYFARTTVNKDLTGVLAVKRRSSNYSVFHDFYCEANELAEARGAFILIDKSVFLRVGFSDKFGDRHEEYFAVGGVSDAHRIESAQGALIFDLWREPSTHLDLEQLNASWLIEAALKPHGA